MFIQMQLVESNTPTVCS